MRVSALVMNLLVDIGQLTYPCMFIIKVSFVIMLLALLGFTI